MFTTRHHKRRLVTVPGFPPHFEFSKWPIESNRVTGGDDRTKHDGKVRVAAVVEPRVAPGVRM